MEAKKNMARDGNGKPPVELASMVGDYNNITDVYDWPGSETETMIEFDEFVGTSLIYIKDHGYEIVYIHQNRFVVRKES